MQPGQPDTAGVIAPPPLIYASSFCLSLLLRPFLPGIPIPSAVRRPLGLFLAAASLALGGWGYQTMHRAGTSVDVSDPVEALVTDGPFRFVRNPLYLSLAVLYSSLALLTNSWSSLATLPLVIGTVRVGVIGREERYLLRRFGKDYQEYKARTPRGL